MEEINAEELNKRIEDRLVRARERLNGGHLPDDTSDFKLAAALILDISRLIALIESNNIDIDGVAELLATMVAMSPTRIVIEANFIMNEMMGG